MSTKKKPSDGGLIDPIRTTLKNELQKITDATPLADRLSIIDRAIKFEALTAKRQDAGLGSGFADDDDDD